MDSIEKGLMAGAGNIGKESFEALNGGDMEKKDYEYIELKTKYKKWDKEELDGKVLVSCKAFRDGLDPFIDERQPFDSFCEADKFYREAFFRTTDGEGIMLEYVDGTGSSVKYDIIFCLMREKCGEMIIESK